MGAGLEDIRKLAMIIALNIHATFQPKTQINNELEQ